MRIYRHGVGGFVLSYDSTTAGKISSCIANSAYVLDTLGHGAVSSFAKATEGQSKVIQDIFVSKDSTWNTYERLSPNFLQESGWFNNLNVLIAL